MWQQPREDTSHKQEAQSTEVTAELTRTWQRGWRGPRWALGSHVEAEHFRTSSGELGPQETHLQLPRLELAGSVLACIGPASLTAAHHVLSAQVTEWCTELTGAWDLCDPLQGL